MKKRKIGILAGMGPRSTAPFLEKVIDECQRQYGATYDMDFPEIHIISLPTPFYPGRAIDSTKMIDALQRGITDLVKSNVSLISIPCNLAHCYFDEISEVSQGTPLLHIADSLLPLLPPPPSTVCLLATVPTLESGFYQQRLNTKGITLVDSDVLREKTTALLPVIKAEGYQSDRVHVLWQEIIAEIAKLGINEVIIACTDLSPLTTTTYGYSITFIDSMAALAVKTVSEYLRQSEELS
ncbi:aspartate racemase [Rosenbergiella nectarea]|uniref:Aspartate racemase n=1 Tax=Rosenbergiella nectarea TaxID=988801 RepID=A0A1H9KAP4_9GAMM|nr:aspartate/glutamate racemase family protein [Rosenbergiella nectarea]SEQ96201.1 aspartate racemase [Rosenbergiella nectarea]